MTDHTLLITGNRASASGHSWHVDPSALAKERGRALFEALFPEGPGRQWYDAVAPSAPLLIQGDADVRGALWESMHDKEAFVALKRGLVRVVDGCAGEGRLAPLDRPLKVLFALAGPVLNPDLDEEDPRQPSPIGLQQRIDLLLGLRGRDFPARFEVRRHVSVAQLAGALPGNDVLHLTCHGCETSLALEKRDWTVDPLPARRLVDLARSAGLRMVVLESCLTARPDADHEAPAIAEQLVRAGVPFVVAMSGAVDGELANLFTQHFYEAVARGRSVIEAARLARTRMHEAAQGRQLSRQHWALPALFVDARAVEAGHLLAPSAVGQAVVEGDADRWPEPRMRPASVFVGRGGKLAQIAAALDPEALSGTAKSVLLLTGHGGTGKTELALQAADRLRRWFSDGLVCVTARASSAPEGLRPAGADQTLLVATDREFAQSLALALDLRFESDPDDKTLVREILRAANDRAVLLVLDNLESVEESPLLRSLLSGLGGRCRVLGTSRHVLRGIDLPTIDVPQLSPSAAADMVSHLALDLGLPQPNAPVLARAARYTPLVIRLAVSLLAGGRSEGHVIRQLEAFEGKAVEELVEYTFGHVLEVAGESEKLLFRCAALYPVPARLAALKAASGLEDEPFQEALAGALRLSLLEPAGEGSEESALLMTDEYRRRVALLPLARAVAERELERDAGSDGLRLRAAEECAGFADAMNDLLSPDRVAEFCQHGGPLAPLAAAAGSAASVAASALSVGLAALDAEWPAPLALADWALAASQWRPAIGFAQTLPRYLHIRARWADWERLCKAGVLAAQSAGDRRAERATLNNLGVACESQGRWDEAKECYRQSLQIKRELGDCHGESQTLTNLGNVCLLQGRWGEAEECCKEALAILRDLGDRRAEGATLNSLGNVYRSQGRWDDAKECYEQSLAIFRGLGDRQAEGATLNNLGSVHDAQGRWGEAQACYEQSLQIKRELGDRHGEGQTLNNLGNVCRVEGCWGEAEERCKEALAIFRDLGDRHGEAQTLNDLGNVYGSLGRCGEAEECYKKVLGIFGAIGDRHGEAQTLGNLGVVYQLQGRWGEAEKCYEQSLQIARSLGDRQGEGQTLGNLGNVHRSQGHWGEAEECYVQSLQIGRELGDRDGLIRTLRGMAVLRLATGAYGPAMAPMAESMKWSLGLHETRVAETTVQVLDLARGIARAGGWDTLAALAAAIQAEVETAEATGFVSPGIAGLAPLVAVVALVIAAVAESRGESSHAAFAGARDLARQVDEATGGGFHLGEWLEGLAGAGGAAEEDG